MKEFQSCKAAIEFCQEHKYFAVAHLYHDEKTMDMHIHNSYELYFSISGGKQFLIDNQFYSIAPGDIFFINQFESHHLTQIDKEIHERIVLSIHPDYLKKISSEITQLDHCFLERKIPFGHKISFHAEDQKRFLYYVHKICNAEDFGSDLMEQASFMELMVFINKIFLKNKKKKKRETVEKTMICHPQADHILTYINQNITQHLTIEELADQFYLSPSYLCRIFKGATGTTINKYITAKRITIAKEQLSLGSTVNEACEACGFRDYSNFLKSFTKAVGISPKKYGQFTS